MRNIFAALVTILLFGISACASPATPPTATPTTQDENKASQIKHFDIKQTETVVAGKDTLVGANSEIKQGDAQFSFSNLESWMMKDKADSKDEFIKMNPPLEVVGKTFTIHGEAVDFVNASRTESFTITITVIAPSE